MLEKLARGAARPSVQTVTGIIGHVITDDRQYRAAKEEARKFEEAIVAARKRAPGPEVQPCIHEAMIESLESELAILREQLGHYEE